VNTRTYRVTHRTRYRYGATMTDGYSVACLVPRPTAYQVVHEADVKLVPSASEWDSYLDVFGNLVNQFGLHEPHTEMLVEAVSVVEVSPRPEPIDVTPWEQVAGLVADARGDLALEVGSFRSSSAFIDVDRLGPGFVPMVAHAFPPGRPIVEAVRALCLQIFDEFEFDPHFSNVATPLEAVLSARRGVCQDFAHLAIGCLRSLGLAARYVSGYIESAPPPGEQRMVGADASHAWCSVWTPEAGWIDFDPTNGHLPADEHVTVAWGRDYDDVIPVRGVMIGPATSQDLDVSVDVARM
jgi:transglutaminase-like putative cysteine protease